VNRFTLTKKFRSEILTPPVLVDDQPAIVHHGEFSGPHFAGAPVDLDPGDDRDDRTRTLGVGDTAVP
jgi:hypothetical protein